MPQTFSSILVQYLQLSSAGTSLFQQPTAVDANNNITYLGTRGYGVEKFLNIPYGQDTSGEKRFASPEAYQFAANVSTYDARVAGPICPQPGNTTEGMSEDCLKLKVTRPIGVKAGDKLPVMVYIYGGSLFTGSINDPTNEPDGLILQSVENGLPVVHVAMNYRLNIFGFALSEPLRTQNSLNVGLKDQRLALEWVQQNIAYFGGDPDRVTIYGQSSGGLSVTVQILAYGGSKPIPFHGAIIQSTALEPGSTSNITFDAYNSVVKLTGCDVDEDPQSAASLECLRSLSFQKLLNSTITQAESQNTGDIYLPTVDGDFLPSPSSELTVNGRFPKIPVMVGWTDQDATLFTDSEIASPSDTRNFIHLLFPGLTDNTLTTLLSLYPATNSTANLQTEFFRAAEIFRDILFTCPSFLFGYAMAQKYWAADETPAVYYYDHNQTVEGYVTPPELGAVHTSEFPYIFANFSAFNESGGLHPTADDFELQKRQSRTWSGFANEGKPSLDGRETLEGWESAYGSGQSGMFDASLYVIGGPHSGLSPLDGKGANPELEKQQLRERCLFLNSADVVAQLEY
ncbi:hypothetical protein AAF712_009556 [Marasmius tenuissimus]|uniref:Carboxylic ester hydrolase n=1 Tax=Marasmius tenuissimus TaxID=585030 RepID=A0ABR2ZQZ5_9AGAR